MTTEEINAKLILSLQKMMMLITHREAVLFRRFDSMGRQLVVYKMGFGPYKTGWTIGHTSNFAPDEPWPETFQSQTWCATKEAALAYADECSEFTEENVSKNHWFRE